MNWLVALAALPGLVIAAIVCALLRVMAPKWGFVDHPGNRKIHNRPLPYGGGVAIWAGVVVPFAIAQTLLLPWSQAYRANPDSARLDFSFAGEWGVRLAEFVEPHLPGIVSQTADLAFFLAAASVLMLLGLIDDTRNLDWRFRLAVETLVAAAVVFGRGWKLTLFIDWPLATDVVSVLWIVGLINSFNMLDNMDGLAAGVAAIASAILGVVMLLTPESANQPQLFVAGFLLRARRRSAWLLDSQPPAGANHHGGRGQLLHWFFAGRDHHPGHVYRRQRSAARDSGAAVRAGRADLRYGQRRLDPFAGRPQSVSRRHESFFASAGGAGAHPRRPC